MVTPDLIEFIRKEEARGVSRESIISLLRAQSWTDSDIMEAFDIISPISNLNQPNKQNIPQSIPGVSNEPNAFVLPLKSRKKTTIISIASVIILLVGFSLAYTTGYIVPFKKILSKAIQFSSNDKNSSVTLDMNIKFDTSDIKSSKDISESIIGLSPIVNLGMKGSFETIDKKNPKLDFNLVLTSGSVKTDIRFKFLNKSMYVNIIKAPDLGFFSLKPFENKWVVLPNSDSNNLNINPLISTSGFINNLTDDQKKHIEDITNRANLIVITKRHLPSLINGTISFHFDFDIDKQGIASYLKELTTYIKTIDPNASQLQEITETDFNKFSNAVKNFHGEAWVGIFDKLPHKIAIELDILNPDKPGDGTLKILSDITYSDWNKALKVEIPKEVTTIEELLSSVMGGDMFSGASKVEITDENLENADFNLVHAEQQSGDATIQNIESALRAQAELYYDANNNSYAGFCRSKSNYGAYTYAIKLPKGTEYKCNDSKYSWASWSKLSNGKYFCVDSVGVVESIVGLPQGTSCPSR